MCICIQTWWWAAGVLIVSWCVWFSTAGSSVSLIATTSGDWYKSWWVDGEGTLSCSRIIWANGAGRLACFFVSLALLFTISTRSLFWAIALSFSTASAVWTTVSVSNCSILVELFFIFFSFEELFFLASFDVVGWSPSWTFSVGFFIRMIC